MSRLMRWRCRLRSPQAGQQQLMIGSVRSFAYCRASDSVTADQRTDDHVLAVVGDEAGRHGLQCAGEEEVQEQRLDEVVEVMAERDLGGADFGGQPVEHAAAEPRAQRARRRVAGEQILHHVADLGVDDPVFPAASLTRARDQIVAVAVVAGIDGDADQRERDRRALAQDVEDLQESPAVLAARQPDHHPIAILDQVVFGDGLRDFLGDSRFERRGVTHDACTATDCTCLEGDRGQMLSPGPAAVRDAIAMAGPSGATPSRAG